MTARHLIVLLGLAALAAAAHAGPVGEEQNWWPVSVSYRESAVADAAWTGAGPFLYRDPKPGPKGFLASGFRPFWIRYQTPEGVFRAGYGLYPLFHYRVDDTSYHWSVFELIRRSGRREGAEPPASTYSQRSEMEVFPFWFSKESGDPARSYRGLFPIHGTLRDRLGFERLSWTLFPLYSEVENRGAVTTSLPWPFIRVTRGAAQGWGLWPLYHSIERPGAYRRTAFLWPLGHNHTTQPPSDAEPGTPPRRDFAALPFYARNTGPGYINEQFLWPFFGYSDRTLPTRYRETSYFWPLLVQGRGDGHYVNRWGPFYTHSIHKGYDKQWIAWPLVRYATWQDGSLARTRTQFLFFLYWNEEQRTAGNPQSRTASLTHLWPLVSHWDNGAGRIQWQALSPLDVFFPHNEKMRHAWSPFFAVARHEQLAPGHERTSLLWNAVTWSRRTAEEQSEFHLGPVLGITRRADERRIAVGNGLFGFRRTATTGWRMFWLDFSPTPATASSASR